MLFHWHIKELRGCIKELWFTPAVLFESRSCRWRWESTHLCVQGFFIWRQYTQRQRLCCYDNPEAKKQQWWLQRRKKKELKKEMNEDVCLQALSPNPHTHTNEPGWLLDKLSEPQAEQSVSKSQLRDVVFVLLLSFILLVHLRDMCVYLQVLVFFLWMGFCV